MTTENIQYLYGFFCRRVEDLPGGRFHASYIDNQIVIESAAPSKADALQLLMGLSATSNDVECTVTVRVLMPKGKDIPIWDGQIPVAKERVSRINMNVDVIFEQEGLHWFRVLLDAREVTRIPFQVQFFPIPEAWRQESSSTSSK